MPQPRKNDELPAAEVEKRRDDALRRALAMPPQPKISKPKKKKSAKA